MQGRNLAGELCPTARSIDLIGEWGSLMILREAFGGTTRFDDFQKQLGICRNLLSTRLKKLVEGGILERQAVSADGRRQEYVLTGSNNAEMQMLNPGEAGFEQGIEAKSTLGQDWQKKVDSGINNCF